MSDLIGAEFAVVFDPDSVAHFRFNECFTFGAEWDARHELCQKLKIENAKPVDRDENGNLLVAFYTTREHLHEIHERLQQSCGYGDFDARCLCVWPDPDGEMLTGEALTAWLED